MLFNSWLFVAFFSVFGGLVLCVSTTVPLAVDPDRQLCFLHVVARRVRLADSLA